MYIVPTGQVFQTHSYGMQLVQSLMPMPEGPAEDFPETQPLPALQVIHVPTISHGDQGIVHVDSYGTMYSRFLTVLPANWLSKHRLVTKRIWAYVHNSKPDPFNAGGGFASGEYDRV